MLSDVKYCSFFMKYMHLSILEPISFVSSTWILDFPGLCTYMNGHNMKFGTYQHDGRSFLPSNAL